MRRRPVVGVVLLAAVALVACTSSDDSGPATSTMGTTGATSATEAAIATEPAEATEANEPAVIPPCTPIEGGIVDPCEPGLGPLVTNPNAHSEDYGAAPRTMREYLESSGTPGSHIVVRATYLAKSVRCVTDTQFRSPPWGGQQVVWDGDFIQCFADVRTNSYILGSGPDILTVLVLYHVPFDPDLETVRSNLERAFMSGGRGADIVEVVGGGLPGREVILFLGPAHDYTLEAWQVINHWDVQRKSGTVQAVHPHWEYWDLYGTAEQKAETELTLSEFTTAVTAANTARKAANNGRAGPDPHAPMIIASANASDLHQHHVDVGNTAHADGPPETSLPPPCGKAVPNQVQNPGLMLDCKTLLAAKDELRGTGTLNWSVDVPMAQWDGVRIEDGQVAALVLGDKGLTGCVPPSLREVAVDGLDALGLPDCAG